MNKESLKLIVFCLIQVTMMGIYVYLYHTTQSRTIKKYRMPVFLLDCYTFNGLVSYPSVKFTLQST